MMRLGLDEFLAVVGATVGLTYTKTYTKRSKISLGIALLSIGYLIGKKVR